jgi:hypothetical protein
MTDLFAKSEKQTECVTEADYYDFYCSDNLLDAKESKKSRSQVQIQFINTIHEILSLSRYLKLREQYLYQIQNWYSELKSFTTPTQLYLCSEEEQDVLLFWNTRSEDKRIQFADHLCNQFNFNHETKHFMRTGECSSKDEKGNFSKQCGSNWVLEGLYRIANSQRCRDGILFYSDFPNFATYLAFREWIPNMDEYRCFVYDSRLTAVCEHDARYSSFQEKNIPQWMQGLIRFFDSFLDDLPFTKAVVDISFSSSFQIVECNPFRSDLTGSVLFDWCSDEIILKGLTTRSSVTYRYQTCMNIAGSITESVTREHTCFLEEKKRRKCLQI